MLLVVDDRDRHQQHVAGGGLVGLERVDQPLEHAHLGRAELAGAGPAALEVPLQVGAPAQQVAEVEAQHRGVDRVVAGRAADEDQAGPAAELGERPQREVDAAEDVVGREAVAPQGVAQHQRVEVGAVVGQEHQRVLAVQLAQRRQRGPVGVHDVRPGQPAAHPVPGSRGLRVDLRGELVQAASPRRRARRRRTGRSSRRARPPPRRTAASRSSSTPLRARPVVVPARSPRQPSGPRSQVVAR